MSLANNFSVVALLSFVFLFVFCFWPYDARAGDSWRYDSLLCAVFSENQKPAAQQKTKISASSSAPSSTTTAKQSTTVDDVSRSSNPASSVGTADQELPPQETASRKAQAEAAFLSTAKELWNPEKVSKFKAVNVGDYNQCHKREHSITYFLLSGHFRTFDKKLPNFLSFVQSAPCFFVILTVREKIEANGSAWWGKRNGEGLQKISVTERIQKLQSDKDFQKFQKKIASSGPTSAPPRRHLSQAGKQLGLQLENKKATTSYVNFAYAVNEQLSDTRADPETNAYTLMEAVSRAHRIPRSPGDVLVYSRPDMLFSHTVNFKSLAKLAVLYHKLDDRDDPLVKGRASAAAGGSRNHENIFIDDETRWRNMNITDALFRNTEIPPTRTLNRLVSGRPGIAWSSTDIEQALVDGVKTELLMENHGKGMEKYSNSSSASSSSDTRTTAPSLSTSASASPQRGLASTLIKSFAKNLQRHASGGFALLLPHHAGTYGVKFDPSEIFFVCNYRYFKGVVKDLVLVGSDRFPQAERAAHNVAGGCCVGNLGLDKKINETVKKMLIEEAGDDVKSVSTVTKLHPKNVDVFFQTTDPAKVVRKYFQHQEQEKKSLGGSFSYYPRLETQQCCVTGPCGHPYQRFLVHNPSRRKDHLFFIGPGLAVHAYRLRTGTFQTFLNGPGRPDLAQPKRVLPMRGKIGELDLTRNVARLVGGVDCESSMITMPNEGLVPFLGRPDESTMAVAASKAPTLGRKMDVRSMRFILESLVRAAFSSSDEKTIQGNTEADAMKANVTAPATRDALWTSLSNKGATGLSGAEPGIKRQSLEMLLKVLFRISDMDNLVKGYHPRIVQGARSDSLFFVGKRDIENLLDAVKGLAAAGTSR
ncbi:unnamed protein product [Amoebophrya sp. A120]|nr:unnamed protein product [Amoebophrya sp. A120]|eukprot:GSA120T00020126001.1